MKAIADVFEFPVVDTKTVALDPVIAALVPEEVARANCVVPIAEEGNTVVILTADPSAERRKGVEKLLSGKPVKWKVADAPSIRTFIDRSYRADADIDRLVAGFDSDEQSAAAKKEGEVNLDDQAPIVQLVSRIVSQAMRDRASDIHVEPLDDKLRIRFRIDGHLVEAFTPPARRPRRARRVVSRS